MKCAIGALGKRLDFRASFTSLVQQDSRYVGLLLFNSVYEWNGEILHRYFWPEMAWNVATIPLLLWPHADKIVWKRSRDGRFTIKNAYYCANKDRFDKVDTALKQLWKSKLHERHKLLLWIIAHNCQPTGERLNGVFRGQHRYCSVCEAGADSMIHLFWVLSSCKIGLVWQQMEHSGGVPIF